ncbi:RING-type domain-containing protein [Psidium guajava]|nr:RING-type domain-containing protein [Psidium guajava]
MINNEASSDFQVPIHKNNQVGLMHTMVEPEGQLSPGMAKTKLKSDSVETLVFVSDPLCVQLTQKEVFASKDLDREVEVTGPGASAATVLEKAKSRTEMASPSKLAVGQTISARKVESFPHGSTRRES